MREDVKRLEFDKYEIGILLNALYDFREKLILEQKKTDYVDEILVKTVDTPYKKKVLTRYLKRDEIGY